MDWRCRSIRLRLVYPDILKETMIAQSGLTRARDFPDVPLAVELCKDPDKLKVVEFFQVQEEMGRSYALPQGTPPARVDALRKAFDAVMKDTALLALAKERPHRYQSDVGRRVAEARGTSHRH